MQHFRNLTLCLATTLALVPTLAHAKDKDQLELDLNKAVGTFWSMPTHPDYIDDTVEVDSDEMKQNLVCVNRALGQTSASMKAIWATKAYKKLGVYLIKSITKGLELAGVELDISKAADIAQLALEATSGDELEEKLVKKLGEEAVERISKKGVKIFDKIYEHYLPENASPIQKKIANQKVAGCVVDYEFTLTPPRKGERASIRLEANTQRCRATNAGAQGDPRSYRLVATADLIPGKLQKGTLGYEVQNKKYILTGECGNFPEPPRTGHLPFKPLKFPKGKFTLSPSVAIFKKNVSVAFFAGVGEQAKYFKPTKLSSYPEQQIKAVRVKFDKGDTLEARSTRDTSVDGKDIGVGYWFEIPEGAQKVVGIEVDVVIGDKTLTATWSEKDIASIKSQ